MKGYLSYRIKELGDILGTPVLGSRHRCSFTGSTLYTIYSQTIGPVDQHMTP